MVKPATVLRLVLLSLIAIGGAAAADLADARRALVAHLVDEFASGRRRDLPVDVAIGAGAKRPALLSGAAAPGATVSLGPQGGTLVLAWQQINDDTLRELCRPVLGTAPAAIQAAWLRLGRALPGGGGEKDKALLAALRLKDPALAKELDAEPGAAAPGPGAVAAKPADEGGADGPADGPADGSDPAAGNEGEGDSDLDRWIGRLTGKDGKLNRSAYLRAARTYDGNALSRRFGPDYAFFDKERKSETFPEIWERPDRGSHKNPTGYETPYQVGDWIAEAGGYSSTVSQILYLPEAKGDHGVDRVYVGGNSQGCYWQKPFHWLPGGAHPEPAMLHPAYNQAAGGFLDRPVAQARGFGTWTNCSLMVFQSGVVAIAGSNTSSDRYPLFRFPPGKVPKAIAMTSQNEFALVAVWDTEQGKGQVAVLAMEAGYGKDDGLMAIYSWWERYPGLANPGGYRWMKLLGYVDLPNMVAPTAISAWSNARSFGGWKTFRLGLESQEQRDKWRLALDGKGELDYSSGCLAGYAMVASRSENKVAFIDLGPLFTYVSKMYFTDQEHFAKTRDLGEQPGQWPHAFEAAPQSRPRVAEVVTAKLPTAVACGLFGPSSKSYGFQDGRGCQGYVATMDGSLIAYDVSSLTQAVPAAAPSPIRPVAKIKVGRNPCWLTYDRTQFFPNPRNRIIAVSRGDRRIDWVDFTGQSATIVRTLRDRRLLDPVCAEVTDNHSNYGKILCVTDFKGRKVTGYRFEEVTLTTGTKVGMGPDGKADIECTGSLEFPGHPFSVSCSNVN